MRHVKAITRETAAPATAENLLVIQQKAIILDIFVSTLATAADIAATLADIVGLGGGE